MLKDHINPWIVMQNQFEIIQPWIPVVLSAIKREIRMDHLANSPSFVRAHFGTRPVNRLTAEEIFPVYVKELLKGDAELSEWVINRWVFNHGDLYSHFAERLEAINADYDAIKSLTEEESEKILDGACLRFGALPVYLFSVLNQVVFPQSVFDRLRRIAEAEELNQKEETLEKEERQNFEQMKERLTREMNKMQEKYESKIVGVMKKYTTDTEALKKQIRALQRQLQAR